MAGRSGAIFLSYASEDSDAARRLADALLAAGLQTWFDKGELRGGDAWDQKIRTQIKDCALFMPLISANTNARVEGYFRLEWKLAVDRSHLMADDAAFIFPVALDGTTEAEARVPDRFREYQWMRLGEATAQAVSVRAAKLVAGQEQPVARSPESRRPRVRSKYVWPILGILIAAYFVLPPQWRKVREVAPPATTQVSEPAKLARRAVDMARKLSFTKEDLVVAADLARRATELDPTFAPGWGARARVESAWVMRGWDTSEPRRQAAQESARRALAIDPGEPNALLIQAGAVLERGALSEAEALLERALRAAPDDNHIRRTLAATYLRQGRTEEARAAQEESIRRDPRDPLPHLNLANGLANTNRVKDADPANIDKALAHLERSIQLQPTAAALNWKACTLAAWKGDFPAALATLDRVAALPHEQATEDRSIYLQMWVALLAREPERALAVGERTTSSYFVDQLIAQPVAWMRALAHQQARRESTAAEQWRTAESLLRTRLAGAPDSLDLQAQLAVTLAMLGRREEAARQFVRYEGVMRDQGKVATLMHVRFYAAMRDGKRLAGALREARKPMMLWVSDVALERDPWFEGVRGNPEFAALLREIAAKK